MQKAIDVPRAPGDARRGIRTLLRGVLGVVVGLLVFFSVFLAVFWSALRLADLPILQSSALGYVILILVWSAGQAPCLAGLLAGYITARVARRFPFAWAALVACIVWETANPLGMQFIYYNWESAASNDVALPLVYVLPGVLCVLLGAWIATRRHRATLQINENNDSKK